MNDIRRRLESIYNSYFMFRCKISIVIIIILRFKRFTYKGINRQTVFCHFLISSYSANIVDNVSIN